MDSVIKIAGILAAIIIVACTVVFIAGPLASHSSGSGRVVYFFYGEECPHCHEVMPFIINMSRKYPEANITMLEVWHNETNQEIAVSVNKRLNRDFEGVPEVIIGDVVLSGSGEIPDEMERVLRDWLKK